MYNSLFGIACNLPTKWSWIFWSIQDSSNSASELQLEKVAVVQATLVAGISGGGGVVCEVEQRFLFTGVLMPASGDCSVANNCSKVPVLESLGAISLFHTVQNPRPFWQP